MSTGCGLMQLGAAFAGGATQTKKESIQCVTDV
jgi:hypothetical protein